MFKFHEELNMRKNYYLLLREQFTTDKIYLKEVLIPTDFCKKWKHLFNFGKELRSMFEVLNVKHFDFVLRYECSPFAYEIYSIYCRLEEMEYRFNTLDKIYLTTYDARELFDHLSLCCDYMIGIKKEILFEDASLYKKMQNDYKKALCKLKSLTVLIERKKDVEKIFLPDAWYITSNGNLYNSTGNFGHKESNLIYPYFYMIKNMACKPNGIKMLRDENIKRRNRIIKDGCISRQDFIHYLNYVATFDALSLDNKRVEYYKQVSYDRKIYTIILGIIEAQISIYDFFYRVATYAKNSEIEFEKVSSLTNDYISDILVRCCGFSKVE